jgi:hypothetical protein
VFHHVRSHHCRCCKWSTKTFAHLWERASNQGMFASCSDTAPKAHYRCP